MSTVSADASMPDVYCLSRLYSHTTLKFERLVPTYLNNVDSNVVYASIDLLFHKAWRCMMDIQHS